MQIDISLEQKKNKKIKKEKFLYFLICSFAIISSLTIILDFFHLREISKLFQAFTLIMCPILVLQTSQVTREKKTIIRLSSFITIYLIILFVFDLFTTNISFSVTSRSFLQICFIYFWITIAFSISDELLDKVLLFIQKFFLLGVFFSILELLIIPSNVKLAILLIIHNGEAPVSYFSRDIDLGFLRLGSFYLNPLTFSFTLLFLISYYKVFKDNTKSIVILIISVLAQTKTAILGCILILLGKEAKFVNKVLLISTFSIVLFICVFFDGWFFYYAFDNTSLKSLANHLSGLVFGVQEAFSCLFGNGFGRSGFLVFLDSKEDPSLTNVFNITEYENGNESTIGILGYQLGGFFLILHLILFLKLFAFQLKNKNYCLASFALLIILFQFFSESSLTLLMSFCQACLLAKGSVHNCIKNR